MRRWLLVGGVRVRQFVRVGQQHRRAARQTAVGRFQQRFWQGGRHERHQENHSTAAQFAGDDFQIELFMNAVFNAKFVFNCIEKI